MPPQDPSSPPSTNDRGTPPPDDTADYWRRVNERWASLVQPPTRLCIDVGITAQAHVDMTIWQKSAPIPLAKAVAVPRGREGKRELLRASPVQQMTLDYSAASGFCCHLGEVRRMQFTPRDVMLDWAIR